MDATHTHDDILFNLLSDGGQIIPFFESVFGFLYRRTDFFKIHNDAEGEIGFPPGIAERIVMRIFKQWDDRARQDEILDRMKRLGSDGVAPAACAELEVTSEHTPAADACIDHQVPEESCRGLSNVAVPRTENTYLSYNGAVRDGYSWSQTICDVDITVEVPPSISRATQVRVEVTSQNLSVTLAESNELLLQGDFTQRTRKEEAVWSLVPGKHVQVHLEKCVEQWWDSLFTTEIKIDVTQLDVSRPLAELSQADQMKVEELVWNKERREREKMGAEDMLKKAWHQEGSPFKDMAYDPSVVQFENPPPAPDNT